MNNPPRCAWNETKCEKPVKKDGYCLKHHTRGVLLEEAKKKGVRICDDGKRVCRNETFNNKLKCEECLKKTREREMSQYNERKAKGVCTMCGVTLENATKGIKDNLVQKCDACYSTMRKVEDNRKRERNYSSERLLNPERHYREYAASAIKKNVEFTITLEEFSNTVTKPCYYCKTYNETEVLGIDRIDSFKGYVKGNILPACEICNTMKKQLTMKEFANHISLLYKNFVSEFKEEIIVEEASPSYKFRPVKIVEYYSKKKLDVYIELCKSDKRSASYIQKLIDATAYTMTNSEFRDYLENATRVEIRSQQLTLTNERKRVPRKEIFALLNLNKPLEVVKLYESVFGPTENIRNNMIELAKEWNTMNGVDQKAAFEKYVIKYNNDRARQKKSDSECSSVEAETAKPRIIELSAEIPNLQVSSLPNKGTYLQAPTPPVSEIPEPPLTQTQIKQWKVSNIWSAFQNKEEKSYKHYLETLEDIKSLPDWEQRWQAFVESLQDPSTAQEKIKEFVLNLRTIRHNALSYKKNDCLLDRDDREVWRTETIIRAFKLNKLEQFKEFTETAAGDKTDDPVWMKRWQGFVSDVSGEPDDTKKKNIISKFLASQRTKKFRRTHS